MKLISIPTNYAQDIRKISDLELIKNIQQNLVSTGYLSNQSEIDGIIGQKTINAFINFKKDNYLEHPFILGKTTANKLLSQAPLSYKPNSLKYELTPRREAILDLIRYTEGTDRSVDDKDTGFNIIFSGRTFKDYSKHPDILIKANGLASTAAGAYQFLDST
ncbi:hypothetical protein C7H19_24655 [Aphanothece hegewaldii CCALA 016]|uniref:Peptidoglycan binding-like domain-containing protein n=1 Tax=Aphanothece hegewaldii CCALA 016 TaxID=2107694 RepID=A0A2T1LQK6_9CHRO|nr:hypothetical protein [Aphanothece hegewaldii]PSF28540.1 hypothetical protein C7H19_24655 [Aphanothece hegewaldii CCALA 016]